MYSRRTVRHMVGSINLLLIKVWLLLNVRHRLPRGWRLESNYLRTWETQTDRAGETLLSKWF